MKQPKGQTTHIKENLTIAATALLGIWLLTLTLFAAFFWSQHIWQAGVDNEAIYRLQVQNEEQQRTIDSLR